jgi:predicted nuclease of predicted toxin-antitoxin system
MSARDAGAIVITKDIDFVRLHEQFGALPKVLWLTLGNTSNAHMRNVFSRHLDFAVKTHVASASRVEIQDDFKV